MLSVVVSAQVIKDEIAELTDVDIAEHFGDTSPTAPLTCESRYQACNASSGTLSR